jgi:hypothetical protein
MTPLTNLTVDVENGTVTWTHEGKTETLPINHPRSFEMASHAWLRCGWDVKHVYSFAWMGRPSSSSLKTSSACRNSSTP